MLQMTCSSDKDCPEYSTCETINDGNKSLSICKFGDFFCPESTDGYFMNSNMTQSCVYVNAAMYDLDKEEIKEGFPKDIKPILKTCGLTNKIKCTTERCNRNTDCFSGMCLNNSCINGDNLNYEIYRCSVDDAKYSMKCRKANGMKCGDDSECYSDICTNGDDGYKPKYCSNTGYTEFALKSMLVGIPMIVGFIILCILILYILKRYKK